MRFSTTSAAVLALALPLAIAQTSTDCNPLDKTCPNDVGLNAASFTSDFTKGKSAFKSWSAAGGTTLKYGSQGAEFIISAAGQAPTVQTDFYFFFGRVDVKMRAAPGTGIISSVVLESDDLDEIDLEWIGGNTAQVETNFFGKGNTTTYDRATYVPVTTPQTEMHTYSVDWNSDRIEWLVDNKIVRTVKRTDPLALGGKNYPQTPMRLKLGSWCGGCKGEPSGTVAWAGGAANFDGAPYIMYVESVSIKNYNPAASYKYSDKSGSWQSIKLLKSGKSKNPSGGSAHSKRSTTDENTVAPTSSLSVNPLSNTGIATTSTGEKSPVGATPNPNRSTPSDAGQASATPKNSGSKQSGEKNTAATLPILTSGSLLGVLFCFLLL